MANKTINQLPTGTVLQATDNFAVQDILGQTKNITGQMLSDFVGGGIVEVTYNEATANITNNTLEAGRFYLMTDFQTVYDQPDYDDASTPKTTVVTKTAPVDPILLLATSANTFAKEVWRPSTPQHRLEYDINFSQTEVMGAPAKGRITKCIDEFGNETHYDHTVVLLKRYESVSGSGIFNSFWDTGFGSTEVLTFGNGCVGNKIGDNYYELVGGFAVSSNVLGVESLGNTIGISSNNNTFGNYTQYNTFGISSNNNTFGNDTYSNTFGNYTQYNTFGNDAGNNTFGDDTNNNTFGNNTNNNTFGNNTNNNTFGISSNNNTFGNDTYSNTFGNYTQYNTFGNDAGNNTFGDDTNNNTFGNNTNNNTFGNNTNNNTFGNSIVSIDFTITPTPTHIYGNYLCNIFKRQDGTVRLSYYDNTDALVVVAPTA